MANDMHHLYLTCHGEYVSGPWEGETGQIGFRFGFFPVLEGPALGETVELPLNGEAVPEFGTADGDNGTLTKTWTARVGGIPSQENWGEAEQIEAAEIAYTLLTALKAYQASDFKWTSVKQAPIDSLGHTIGTASTYTFTSPLAGASASQLPAQCAIAISSRANIVGRGGRGRFYLPAVAQTGMTADGQLGSTAMNALTAAFKVFIDSMQGVVGGFDLMNAIYVVTSAGRDRAVRPAEVRCGSLIDTIRSRRAQVDESYVVVAL